MQHALLSRPILSLTLSSFAIGLSEFVTIGLMSPISESLSIGLPETGLLITLYAMGVSIGAPSIAYCTRHFSSKTVCLWLIALFAFANLLSAVTYTFPLLLLTRIGAGAAHGAFFSVASNLAPALVTRDKAPLAIAVMFSGLTLAMILGVPSGIIIGHHFGWQSVFFIVAALAIISGGLISTWMPNIRDQASKGDSLSILNYFNKKLLALYAVTVFGFGGGFVFFSYAEPYISNTLSAAPGMVAGALLIVGGGSLLGNIFGGKLGQSIGLTHALYLTVSLQVMALVGLGLFSSWPIAVCVFLFVWAVFSFAVAPIIQTGVVMISTESAGLNPRISAGLNATAFNIGISTATFLASLQVDLAALRQLPFTAAAAVSLALPIIFMSRSRLKNHTLQENTRN